MSSWSCMHDQYFNGSFCQHCFRDILFVITIVYSKWKCIAIPFTRFESLSCALISKWFSLRGRNVQYLSFFQSVELCGITFQDNPSISRTMSTHLRGEQVSDFNVHHLSQKNRTPPISSDSRSPSDLESVRILYQSLATPNVGCASPQGGAGRSPKPQSTSLQGLHLVI